MAAVQLATVTHIPITLVAEVAPWGAKVKNTSQAFWLRLLFNSSPTTNDRDFVIFLEGIEDTRDAIHTIETLCDGKKDA